MKINSIEEITNDVYESRVTIVVAWLTKGDFPSARAAIAAVGEALDVDRLPADAIVQVAESRIIEGKQLRAQERRVLREQAAIRASQAGEDTNA